MPDGTIHVSSCNNTAGDPMISILAGTDYDWQDLACVGWVGGWLGVPQGLPFDAINQRQLPGF